MDPIREPGHGATAATRRNITHLRDQRDRAGLRQLADTLDQQTYPDAADLATEAREAAAWIATTTPRTHDAGAATGARVGDILRYPRHGRTVQAVIITIDGHTATTTLGDTIDL